jgi:hypothetical protein
MKCVACRKNETEPNYRTCRRCIDRTLAKKKAVREATAAELGVPLDRVCGQCNKRVVETVGMSTCAACAEQKRRQYSHTKIIGSPIRRVAKDNVCICCGVDDPDMLSRVRKDGSRECFNCEASRRKQGQCSHVAGILSSHSVA